MLPKYYHHEHQYFPMGAALRDLQVLLDLLLQTQQQNLQRGQRHKVVRLYYLNGVAGIAYWFRLGLGIL